MNIRETALAFTVGLLALSLPALAFTDDEPTPPKEDPPTEQPEPEPPVEEPEPPAPPVTPPVTPPVLTTNPGGGSAYLPYSRIYYGKCTCTEVTYAWGLERLSLRQERALQQCEARRERIGCQITDQEYEAGVLK